MTDSPPRVMYIQRAKGAGSMIALLNLVARIDRERYEPVVLCYEDNPYIQEFTDLGAESVVLGAENPADGGRRAAQDRTRPSDRPVPRSLPIPDIIRTLHRNARQLRSTRKSAVPLSHRIGRILTDQRTTLVHLNDGVSTHRAGILAARRTELPQVCHVRTIPLQHYWVDRWLARQVDAFVHVSHATERSYHRLGVPARKGSVIRDPLPPPTPAADARERVRTEFGVGARDPLIVNVGRLQAIKGQHRFLEALPDVIRAFPTARILLVGDSGGSESARRFEAELRTRVQTLRINGHVVFTGFRRDIPDILAAADLAVHTATEPDPCPLVVAEALACTVPLVAAPSGGVPEMVRHGETGLLADPENAPALSNAMIRLLREPAAARRMAQKGREDILRRWDPDRHVSDVQDLYDRLLSRAGLPRKRPGSTGAPVPA
jgi:glycosyltransferase involved in cell wall biosynthesis